ncbi:MAG: histidine phosphatase family protein [Granulosicoccus sp.]
MSHTIYFISHPDVEINPTIPVTQWPLSARGITRMTTGLQLPWINSITSVYCSAERKALDGADILADHLNLQYQVLSDLGENDRSATGYLKADEFERTADEFFTSPDTSIRGWETAQSAQDRIVRTVRHIDTIDETSGTIAIISHGAVGTLLYYALENEPINRRWDQPGQGGGNFMELRFSPFTHCAWWKPID